MFKDCDSLLKFSILNNKNKDHLENPIKAKEQIKEIKEINEEENSLIEQFNVNNSLSGSFYDSLEDFDSFSDFSDINEKQQKDTNNSTIKSISNKLECIIPDNIIKLSGMFYNCSSLIEISDISE